MSYAVKYNNYQERQRQEVIGCITSLLNDLQKLAPHPEQPGNKGPLFIKNSSHFKVANDHDTMLGSMMMESMLGAAFSEAVSETAGSWAQDFDFSNALDCYSEYITDVEGSKTNAQKIAAHGQGTLARLSSKPISASFNMRSTISEEMQAFMDDLPKRMKIERNLAYYAKQLDMLEHPAYESQYNTQYEQAKPRAAA